MSDTPCGLHLAVTPSDAPSSPAPGPGGQCPGLTRKLEGALLRSLPAAQQPVPVGTGHCRRARGPVVSPVARTLRGAIWRADRATPSALPATSRSLAAGTHCQGAFLPETCSQGQAQGDFGMRARGPVWGALASSPQAPGEGVSPRQDFHLLRPGLPQAEPVVGGQHLRPQHPVTGPPARAPHSSLSDSHHR